MDLYNELELIKEDIYSIKEFFLYEGEVTSKEAINESSKNNYIINKHILPHYNSDDKRKLLNFIDLLFENIKNGEYKLSNGFFSEYTFCLFKTDYYIYIMINMIGELIQSIDIEVGESNTVEDTRKVFRIHFDKEMKEIYTPIFNKILDDKCKTDMDDFFNKMPTCKRNKNLNSLLNRI
jgi:hypothetical protein